MSTSLLKNSKLLRIKKKSPSKHFKRVFYSKNIAKLNVISLVYFMMHEFLISEDIGT